MIWNNNWLYTYKSMIWNNNWHYLYNQWSEITIDTYVQIQITTQKGWTRQYLSRKKISPRAIIKKKQKHVLACRLKPPHFHPRQQLGTDWRRRVTCWCWTEPRHSVAWHSLNMLAAVDRSWFYKVLLSLRCTLLHGDRMSLAFLSCLKFCTFPAEVFITLHFSCDRI